MEHSLLANYCIFSSVLPTKECYKALSLHDSMVTTRAPNKTLSFTCYETRREVKPLFKQKDRSAKNEFELMVIDDENLRFMLTR